MMPIQGIMMMDLWQAIEVPCGDRIEAVAYLLALMVPAQMRVMTLRMWI
jgi:hypothetical protein